MTRLAKILIAGTAILIPITQACADGSTESNSEILNGQVSLGTVWTNTNMNVDTVKGYVGGSATAVGNAFEAVTMNDTQVTNNQYASGPAIGADMNALVTNVYGSVGLNTQTACNTADVSTDPNYTIVNSNQQCAAQDPSQNTNATVANVAGDVAVTGSAGGNIYTEDTNAIYNYVNTNQLNQSNIASTTSAQVYNVGGSVTVSSAAVGNSAQIIHY